VSENGVLAVAWLQGWPALLALVAVGVLSGFVNTLAGGGTLVSVPALLLAGLPADVANASSRPAVLLQSLTGAVGLARAGGTAGGADGTEGRGLLADAHLAWILPPTVGGGLLGAWLATAVPRDALRPLTVVTMIGVAVLLATRKPSSGAEAVSTPRSPAGRPGALLALLLSGAYGGFLQGGVGFVLLAALTRLLAHDLVRANAVKNVIVGTVTALSLVVFLVADLVAWREALALAAGAVVGARLGVRFARTRSRRAVERAVLGLVVAACVLVLLR
jgi:uncharacterized membrane protein YfcA